MRLMYEGFRRLAGGDKYPSVEREIKIYAGIAATTYAVTNIPIIAYTIADTFFNGGANARNNISLLEFLATQDLFLLANVFAVRCFLRLGDITLGNGSMQQGQVHN